MLYELLFPAVDLPTLQAAIGQQLTLHTIFYLSGDPTRGGMDPTLIGFLKPTDKKFFEIFTTVKGIGPKKALRALSVTVGEIAGAIGLFIRPVSALAAAGISIIMLGALYYHATHTPLQQGIGALIVLLLCVYIIVRRWRSAPAGH